MRSVRTVPLGLIQLTAVAGHRSDAPAPSVRYKKAAYMTQFMDEGARRWLYKYANIQYWRVADWIDFDDLIQDGYAAYCETLVRYPQATERAHIMRLFQLVFRSTIEDRVRANTKQVDDARSDLVEIFDGEAILIPDMSGLHALIIKAPQEIKEALALLLDEKSREELTKPFVKQPNGRRETLNERWCRLLGKDSNSIDVVTELRMYFS